jgi:hypothetical protein
MFVLFDVLGQCVQEALPQCFILDRVRQGGAVLGWSELVEFGKEYSLLVVEPDFVRAFAGLALWVRLQEQKQEH